jgi:hypothetical protein
MVDGRSGRHPTACSTSDREPYPWTLDLPEGKPIAPQTSNADEGAVNPLPVNPSPRFHPSKKLPGFSLGLPSCAADIRLRSFLNIVDPAGENFDRSI